MSHASPSWQSADLRPIQDVDCVVPVQSYSAFGEFEPVKLVRHPVD